MKKIIISFVLIGMLFSFAPITHAQVDSNQQIQDLKTQLIQLLTQMINVLQEQLKLAIAQQTLSQSQISNNQIEQNTYQPNSYFAPITQSVIPSELSFFDFTPTIKVFTPAPKAAGSDRTSITFLIVPEITPEVIKNNQLKTFYNEFCTASIQVL